MVFLLSGAGSLGSRKKNRGCPGMGADFCKAIRKRSVLRVCMDVRVFRASEAEGMGRSFVWGRSEATQGIACFGRLLQPCGRTDQRGIHSPGRLGQSARHRFAARSFVAGTIEGTFVHFV